MEALKLPKLPDLPRPTRWDLYAIGALVVGVVLAGATIALPRLATALMFVHLVGRGRSGSLSDGSFKASMPPPIDS